MILPSLSLTLLFLSARAVTAQQVGPCHPYPGARAADCLQLVSDNLGNETEINCTGGRATLTLGTCSITTACTNGQKTAISDDVVRRALTTIGACALSDRGSISGSYTADDGSKTCYLYAGRENSCRI